MPIINRDRYPGSDFLKASEIKPYAEADGITYVLVGYEDGDRDTPLVARSSTSDPQSEDLFATPMYELLKFSQGAVRRLDGASG